MQKEPTENSTPTGSPERSQSLTPATVSGAVWVGFSELFTKGLGGLKTVILARLLSPTDFGLVGLALVTVGTINTVSGVGIYTALIQKKQLEDDDLNAAWWILFVRGFLLYLILLPVSGVLAHFFEDARLERIFQFIFLTFLFRGFQSIGLVRLSKAMNFKRLTWLHQTSNGVSLIVAVVLGLALQDFWALVVAHLAQLATLVIVSYFLEPFWPRSRIDWKRARDLLRFGKYVLAGTVSTFVVVRGNEFLVAKLVGVDLYGYYALTLSLIRVIYDSIGQLISSLVFPALSKIQDDRGRMGRAFSKVFRVAMLLTAPLTVGVAIFGRDIVHLILGVKWMPIVGPLAWLCFFGWFNALTLTMEAAHYSLGKPELQARLRFAELILYLVGALPMTIKFGIVGAAAWLCMVKIVSFFLHLWASRPHLVGVVRSCGETLFNYWPLGVAQLILAYLHFDMPTAGLGAVILLLSYCLLVVLFVLWKEKELVVEVITVLMERPRLSGAA